MQKTLLAVAGLIALAAVAFFTTRSNRVEPASDQKGARLPTADATDTSGKNAAPRAQSAPAPASTSPNSRSARVSPTVPGQTVDIAATPMPPTAADRETVHKQAQAFMKEYIDGMYTDAKLKEPVPEMAAVMHARYGAETADQSWAPGAQYAIENYLNSSLANSPIDVASIGCKAATCEIIGVLPHSDDDAFINQMMSFWDSTNGQMRNQPWWGQYQLGQPQYEVAMGPNGSTLFFVYLIRQQ